jgi:hypothetical protein
VITNWDLGYYTTTTSYYKDKGYYCMVNFN